MSKTKGLFGLQPLRQLGSGYNTTGSSEYNIANTLSVNMFKGDVVTMNNGFIQPIATTTDYIVGVFQGCSYIDPTTKQPTFSSFYTAATSSAVGNPKAFVVDDPAATFMVQADASVTIGDINSQNFPVTLGAGNTITGISGFGIKAAGRATASKALRPLNVINEPGNSLSGAEGAFPKVEVEIVQHWSKRYATA
tara:strand:+ start:1763 stop:2344 length:582 start_codon:yes stop_codon:yes gene_type:complete